MSSPQNEHARQVVAAFKQKLSAAEVGALAERHYDELALLIESAISSAVLEELERAADKVDALAHQLRHCAEHFDN
ncbi:phosphatase [Marinobacterium arenosum]|uniref:phosphatase n=1 Tax=Marinobacterium arenosum TaxID=2862496 RepID=UPI001C961271|nr:phosphatase [Marinobacterium arenosum]MBY4678600.1 phosphatase [Marinobacterium arenosum]